MSAKKCNCQQMTHISQCTFFYIPRVEAVRPSSQQLVKGMRRIISASCEITSCTNDVNKNQLSFSYVTSRSKSFVMEKISFEPEAFSSR